jgi:alpha-glucosidase
VNREQGLSRARAATMLIMALPGSTYIYQGEELGLFEVTDIADNDLQDPIWLRTGKMRKGRDGCRVPLPWTSAGESCGFGDGVSHLPQPSWFPSFSVEFEEGRPESTLSMYREMIALRKQLQGAERLDWVRSGRKVVHFVRPGGWHSITNFGAKPVALPPGKVMISSGPLDGGKLPAHTTAWVME